MLGCKSNGIVMHMQEFIRGYRQCYVDMAMVFIMHMQQFIRAFSECYVGKVLSFYTQMHGFTGKFKQCYVEKVMSVYHAHVSIHRVSRIEVFRKDSMCIDLEY